MKEEEVVTKVWNFEKEKEIVTSNKEIFKIESELMKRKTKILLSLIGSKIGIVVTSYKNRTVGHMKWGKKGILQKVKDNSIKLKYHDKEIKIDKIILIRKFESP